MHSDLQVQLIVNKASSYSTEVPAWHNRKDIVE
jgi:hypothetical protein